LRHISILSPLLCLEVPEGLDLASTACGKTLLPSSFDGTPRFAIFQRGQDSRIKQAQIKHEKTKEDLETISNHLRDKPARVCYGIIWASAQPLIRFVILIFRCSLGFALLMKIGKPLILAMPSPLGFISTMSTSYSSPILIG